MGQVLCECAFLLLRKADDVMGVQGADRCHACGHDGGEGEEVYRAQSPLSFSFEETRNFLNLGSKELALSKAGGVLEFETKSKFRKLL